MKGKWIKMALGDCCDSPEYGLNASAISFDGKHKYIRITDISDDSHLLIKDNITSPCFFSDEYRVVSGDILFARTGASVGKTYFYSVEDGDLYFAGFLIRFHVKDSYCARYVFYQTLTPEYKSWTERISMRTGQPGINSFEYSQYLFFIPEDVETQQHIADILTSCDEVIEQTEKAIAKYRDIKAGMLQDLFTRGVDANGKLRPKPEDAPQLYKDSPLGKIPKEWEIKTIGDLFDVEVGGDLQKDCFSSYKTVSHQYPIYSNSLENNGLYGYTTAPNYPAESITLTGRGSLGHAEHRKEPFDAIIRLVVLKVKKDQRVDCKFITEQINYDQDFFIESTGVPQLTAPQSAKMRVRMPKIETEQSNIAQHISAIDEKIELEEKTLAKYRSIKLGLMKKLLTPPEGALEA